MSVERSRLFVEKMFKGRVGIFDTMPETIEYYYPKVLEINQQINFQVLKTLSDLRKQFGGVEIEEIIANVSDSAIREELLSHVPRDEYASRLIDSYNNLFGFFSDLSIKDVLSFWDLY